MISPHRILQAIIVAVYGPDNWRKDEAAFFHEELRLR